MFNSLQDLITALLDGRKFILKQLTGHYLYYYDSNYAFVCEEYNGNNVKCLTRQMALQDFKHYNSVTELVKPKWYENIPKQGILCKVRDNKDPYTITTINHFSGFGDNKPFESWDSNGNFHLCFSNATPLTLEEVKQYIYQGD